MTDSKDSTCNPIPLDHLVATVAVFFLAAILASVTLDSIFGIWMTILGFPCTVAMLVKPSRADAVFGTFANVAAKVAQKAFGTRNPAGAAGDGVSVVSHNADTPIPPPSSRPRLARPRGGRAHRPHLRAWRR